MDGRRVLALLSAMLWGGCPLAQALELDGESQAELARFEGLLSVSPVRDTHELSLAVPGAPSLELHLRVGKVSATECHYLETLRSRRVPSEAVRIWRSASALPCDRVAEDLRQNLAGYSSSRPGPVRTRATKADAQRVLLTPGSRIRSEPSLSGAVLTITQGRREVLVGPASAGPWHPVIERGRTVGFVHEAVIEPMRSG